MSVVKFLKKVRSRLPKIRPYDLKDLEKEEILFIASVYSKSHLDTWVAPTIAFRALDQFSWKDRL